MNAPTKFGAADVITETFNPDDGEIPVLTASRRADGWSAERQRVFLETIAEGQGVECACLRVGLSTASAYAFRRTARGAAFALGWRAATLIARHSIAETLLVRALEGQVDTVVRADGSTMTRHRHDNRLAMSLLRRLDRQVEEAPDTEIRTAQIIVQDFDSYLDLIGQDGGAARAGLFLARRGAIGGEGADTRDLEPILALAAADRLVRTGVSTAGEVDIADLDPARRAEWTADQWSRAEAAGLVALAPPPPPPEPDPVPETVRACQESQHSLVDIAVDAREQADGRVWQDEETGNWLTDFPPPPDFVGREEGRFGDPAYVRDCDAEEELAAEALRDAEVAALDDEDRPAYTAWRAAARAAISTSPT